MSRKWQVYQGGPNGGKRMALRITLNSKGVMLFNKRAYEAMGSPAAAELMFDEGSNTIGLKPRDIRFQNSFPFKSKAHGVSKKYNYRIISASPFCKHFDIHPKSTILFTTPDLDNDGTLLLDLNTAVSVGRGSR